MPIVGLALGASIIEKHITLDRTLPGPDHPASLEPPGIGRLVRDIRHAELALGKNEKRLTTMEQLNRQVLRKSLVAARDLPAGTVVAEEMVTAIGPGKGLSPQRLEELVGVLDRDLAAGAYFTEGDLRPRPVLKIEANGLRRTWGLKSRFHDLEEILALKPQLVELHFSEADVDHPFEPPAQPYSQQLVIHAPEVLDRRLIDLCSYDDAWQERSFELVQRTIDRAAELEPHFTGPAAVVIHAGGMTMDEPVADTKSLLERAVEPFRRFETNGVQLLPENLPPCPGIWAGSGSITSSCDQRRWWSSARSSAWAWHSTSRTRSSTARCSGPTLRTMSASACRTAGTSTWPMRAGSTARAYRSTREWDEILELLSQADFTWVPEIWSGHLHHAAGFVEAINRLAAYERP